MVLADRVIRVIIAAVFAVLFFAHIVAATITKRDQNTTGLSTGSLDTVEKRRLLNEIFHKTRNRNHS